MLDLVYIYVHGDVNSWKWATHKSRKLGSPWTMMISQYFGCVNKIVFYWMLRYELWEEIYIYVVSQKDSWLSVDLSALTWSPPPYWDRTRRRVWGRCLGTAELAPGSLSFPVVCSCNTIDLSYIQIYLLVTNLQKMGEICNIFFICDRHFLRLKSFL